MIVSTIMLDEANLSTPLSVYKAFLSGVKAHRTDYMRSLCHAETKICLIRNGKPVYNHVKYILNVLDQMKDKEIEEISYDEVEHVDGQFATVFSPYRFMTDGKVRAAKVHVECIAKT
jgi:hypothetical protein